LPLLLQLSFLFVIPEGNLRFLASPKMYRQTVPLAQVAECTNSLQRMGRLPEVP
jgi:hypothetical protein